MSSRHKPAKRPGAGRRKAEAPELLPVRHHHDTSLAEGVYDSLRVGLMSGAILPGMSLTSRSVAAALGVGATPVRDAMKQLEAEGALWSKSKSAFFVNDPDQKEFQDIVEIRLRLEGLAIRRAALAATPADLEDIRELNDVYAALLRGGRDNLARARMRNFQFHFNIYCLAGSDTLTKMIQSTWTRIGPTLNKFYTISGELAISASAHETMLDALSRNDPDTAEQALHQDILNASKDILPMLRPAAEPSGARRKSTFLASATAVSGSAAEEHGIAVP